MQRAQNQETMQKVCYVSNTSMYPSGTREVAISSHETHWFIPIIVLTQVFWVMCCVWDRGVRVLRFGVLFSF